MIFGHITTKAIAKKVAEDPFVWLKKKSTVMRHHMVIHELIQLALDLSIASCSDRQTATGLLLESQACDCV